jgi:hypothetical protein
VAVSSSALLLTLLGELERTRPTTPRTVKHKLGDIVERMEALRKANVRAIQASLKKKRGRASAWFDEEGRFTDGQHTRKANHDARAQLLVLLDGIEHGCRKAQEERG